LDNTTNFIYPIWWNYLANARGVWATSIGYTDYQLAVKPYLVAWFLVSLASIIVVWFRYKARGSLFILFGLANWAFIAGFMGLTHYLTGFQQWFWVIRFFEFPYVFGGFLLALVFLYIIPKYVPYLSKIHLVWVLWMPILVVIIGTQYIFWGPILEKYNSTRVSWEITKTWAHEFGREYQGGKVLIPEGEPSFTYAMVYFEGIKGKNILGQMFDPFYYMVDDPFASWGDNRRVMLGWLRDEEVKLIVVDTAKEKYSQLFERESQYFEFVKVIPDSKYVIYRVYPERIEIL